MTEYEIADLAISRQIEIHSLGGLIFSILALVSDNVTQYMTVLFGYIAAAYFVGGELRRPQLWVFTGLYILWQVWTVAVLAVRMSGVRVLNDKMGELLAGAPREEAVPQGNYQWIGGTLVLVLLLALIASLYFMWSVRQPRSELPK